MGTELVAVVFTIVADRTSPAFRWAGTWRGCSRASGRILDPIFVPIERLVLKARWRRSRRGSGLEAVLGVRSCSRTSSCGW